MLRKLAQELQIHQVELEMQNQALREAQEELEASRDRYARLYDFAPVGYATVNEHGVILEANLTLSSLLKTERTLLEGKPFVSLMTMESRRLFRQVFEQCRQTVQRQAGEVVIRSHSQENIFAQVIIEPLGGEETGPRFQVGIVDNTEKVLAQRTSQETQEKLNEAFEAARIIAWSHNLADETITMSANAAKVLEVPMERPYRVHKEMLADMPEDDRTQYEQILSGAIEARTSYVAQFRLRPTPAGNIRWFEERGRVVSVSEKACQVRGVLLEITERKRAEEALLLNLERLVGYVTDSVDPVALLDGRGIITCISKTGAGLLGYFAEELAGASALDMAHPDDVRIAQTRLAGLREKPYGDNVMLRLRRKDGKWGWFDLDVSLLVQAGNENGYIVKLTGVEMYGGERSRG